MISGVMGLGLLVITLTFTITGEKVLSYEGYIKLNYIIL